LVGTNNIVVITIMVIWFVILLWVSYMALMNLLNILLKLWKAKQEEMKVWRMDECSLLFRGIYVAFTVHSL
jgi:uncharacterized BrkB/YihY/UPF0761 family membrane protein